MSMLREKNLSVISNSLLSLLLSLISGVCLLVGTAAAARVDNLYSATVSLPEKGAQPLDEAFERALGQVLVKLTGLPEAGRDAARAGLLPNSASLVQQYSRLPGNQLNAQFDAKAIRAALDSAGLPVWGVNRPLVAVWLAIDFGGAKRVILSDASGSPAGNSDEIAVLRDGLVHSADARGLPVVLPLVDAEDLGGVSFADIWGNFQGPVMQASQRYGADAILIGRANSLDITDDQVRWTLTSGSEQASWRGDIAAGPGQAADYLAQRLATYADSADTLRVLVRNVDTLEKYGQLKNYLSALNIVEQAAVARVNADQLEFDLIVRGDVLRLERVLSRSRLLRPASSETDMLETGRLPDLVYAWVADP
ncbi:MAG: DUF2066 domain-containing protein [Gammaproteobacteria bacterium]|nr:DUF2066 domain-containing protein [Gammaproteobacteria bacterium]